LNEQYVRSDVAVLAKWTAADVPGDGSQGNTSYQVVQVSRGAAIGIEKGSTIRTRPYRPRIAGQLALILGTRSRGGTIEWGLPREVNSEFFNYIVRAPARDAEPGERLLYYLPYLEHPNPAIAADCFLELSEFSINQFAAHAADLPRDALRKAIVNPDLNPARRSLFGLMLGLCGDSTDSGLLIDQIAEPAQELRIGLEGVIAGYVMLTGETGLEDIERLKLHNKEADGSEVYSALMAVRYLRNSGLSEISPERLQKALGTLIERPEFTDTVIFDLIRWKDWSIQARLMKLYGDGEYNVRSIKRAIIQYMIASTRDVPAVSEGKPPVHAAEGIRNLDELRRRDPQLVDQVERFFSRK